MIAHKLLKKEYGNHIINEKIDTVETLIRYICNVKNVTNFKILIGQNNIVNFLNKEFPLDAVGEINIMDKKYTLKEINNGIRNNLYFIKNKKEVLSIIEEIFIDKYNDIKKEKLLIGIVRDLNIDSIYNKIKELIEKYNITDYEIYVYDGVEK